MLDAPPPPVTSRGRSVNSLATIKPRRHPRTPAGIPYKHVFQQKYLEDGPPCGSYSHENPY
ncbi:MAG TPA: hypothetical protein VLB04_11375, partial [Methanotrichaceae archaeon]|nr:hypothetical protein [Methanotrichaceae archaeon]